MRFSNTGCIDYFSAETWVDLMSAEISTQCKADKVIHHIHHVIALGLRNPTEGTLKILNSLTLAVCLGVEEAKQVSGQSKKAHLFRIQEIVQTRCAALGPSAV